MNLPQVHSSNIRSWLNKEDVVQETAEQIMKDFHQFGIVIHFSGKIESAYEELHGQLSPIIRSLLQTDHQQLYRLFYRIDIDEKQKSTEDVFPASFDDADRLAHQVMVRELKKVLTRHYLRDNKNNAEG
ncbi:MAG: hypothetical protein JNJ58_00680 [Chitinophagaceae bacterium]|nr:hypothetical protein [Chitinophagaceae bacterium]